MTHHISRRFRLPGHWYLRDNRGVITEATQSEHA